MQDKTKQANSYRSECPISSPLDLIGDKWSLLIIRDILFYHKHTYGQFEQSAEKIASNILSDRLKKLEEFEFITKSSHPTNKKTKVYSLTSKGIDLLPTMVELILWSDKHLQHHIPDIAKNFAKMFRKNKESVINELIDKATKHK